MLLDDDKLKNALPPHRKGIDTEIELEKDSNGREMEGKRKCLGVLYTECQEEN